MKKISAFCMAALLLLAGCGKAPDAPSPDPEGILYSNLADPASQKRVTQLLEAHGVPAEQTGQLMAWAEDFNGRVEDPLPEGFQPMGESGPDYTKVLLPYREEEHGEPIPEANCRLTSFLLMKHNVTTNGTYPEGDFYLLFDVEAIDQYEPFHLSQEELRTYRSLFTWVPLQGAATLEDHISAIQTAWKERDIHISGEGISLVNVYLHAPMDEVRFVGHTGVLMDTEEGLFFVEKYGPIFPFQVTKFQNREELVTYLLSRPDLYGDETELPPIVMENDRLLTPA